MKSQIKIKVGVTAWRETAPPAALNTSLPYTISCQNEKKKSNPKRRQSRKWFKPPQYCLSPVFLSFSAEPKLCSAAPPGAD